jgi:hypothetical protein
VRTLGYPFRFVELAQEINCRMPGYVVERAVELLNGAAKALNGARVLLLGVTNKKDVADQRESPVKVIGGKLRARGADLVYHDPHVAQWSAGGEPTRRADDLDAELAAADLVILLQDHQVGVRPGPDLPHCPPGPRHPWTSRRIEYREAVSKRGLWPRCGTSPLGAGPEPAASRVRAAAHPHRGC